MKELRVVELFAGVGGFRVGLERADKKLFKTVWFNQWEPGRSKQHAHDVYAYKWGAEGLKHTNTDIETVVREAIDVIPDHDLLVGGFPCQDYSVAKPLRQSQGLIGKKGVLWWSIVSLVKQLQDNPGRRAPRVLFLENVDRLLKSPGTQRGRDFAIMLRSLETLGYTVEWRVVNAADYGFPQRRRRVFILAYHNSTKLAQEAMTLGHEEWVHKGVLGAALPVKKMLAHVGWTKLDLPQDEKVVSDTFGVGMSTSPFQNAGMLLGGSVYTAKVEHREPRVRKVLGDILLSDDEVLEKYHEGYYIDDDAVLEKWKVQKGPKKLTRTNKATGIEYTFSEGGMAFPDYLNRPSRTIVTGEGGSGPSRFKHVIRSPESGRHRRLTPTELERLCMFDEEHTAVGVNGPVSDNMRAFFMGNALVVGVIEKIGKELAKREI